MAGSDSHAVNNCEACAAAFALNWAARYCIPHTVTTDRGAQFTSAVWGCLCRTLGMRHILTIPYHPQSNGMVKRFHRQLNQSLKARERLATLKTPVLQQLFLWYFVKMFLLRMSFKTILGGGGVWGLFLYVPYFLWKSCIRLAFWAKINGGKQFFVQ